MGSKLTIHRERTLTTEQREDVLKIIGEDENLINNFCSLTFNFLEIRRSWFLKEWFENNLEYHNEDNEYHQISKEDFENLKSQLEEALASNYKEAKEIFEELNEEDYECKLNEILEMVNKALSYDDRNSFYYSFYN